MKYIKLTQDKKAMVNDDDYEWLNQWKWSYHKRYAVRNSPKVLRQSHLIYMHREIIATPTGMYTDHVNGNGVDNRRCNLRICTTAENSFNSGPHFDNVSGYKGVSWDSREAKWKATIRIVSKRIHIGYYNTAEDAARAYDKAAIKHHGEFAWLNYPY